MRLTLSLLLLLQVDGDALREIESLADGHTSRQEERRILEIFRGMTAATLDAALAAMSPRELHELASDMDDRAFGPDNEQAFLDLFAKDRLADLSVGSRAKVVLGLQEDRTTTQEERAIRDVFLGTRGRDLTALKNGIDLGGDYRDLQQLVFRDIDDGGVRREILRHIETEARKTGALKIYSDVDDTFYVNWVDARYPKKTVYPGVRDFYRELDRGPGEIPDRDGDLLFLSARPYDRAGVAESATHALMRENDVGPVTVLSGDFLHIVGNDAIADKKLFNWKQLRQLYPEYDSVFIGDSGQGDAIFGARAAADLEAVFIHDVTNMSDADKAAAAAKGIFVFDTYVAAATEAFRGGLISRDGLLRVAESAKRELATIPFDSEAQRVARESDLDRDLAAMRAAR